MTNARDLTYGIALGACLMYLFDPRRGSGRRAVLRQKAMRAAHEVESAATIGASDLEHRAEGLAARFSSLFRIGETFVSDDVLIARVRAELGRVCSHPRAVEVLAEGGGGVTLRGHILRTEVDRVLGAVERVPGVRMVDDDLEVHHDPHAHPALSGPTFRSRRRLFGSPAARLVLGLGGAAACVVSLAKGNALGLLGGGAVLLGSAHSIVRRGGGVRRRIATTPAPRVAEATSH
jgi:hypothetical protein